MVVDPTREVAIAQRDEIAPLFDSHGRKAPVTTDADSRPVSAGAVNSHDVQACLLASGDSCLCDG
jgi:hypothetical protein